MKPKQNKETKQEQTEEKPKLKISRTRYKLNFDLIYGSITKTLNKRGFWDAQKSEFVRISDTINSKINKEGKNET